MVIDCPGCTTRFSFDLRRFAGKRVKIRCSRCGRIFHQEIRSRQYPHNQVRTLVAHPDRALCLAIGDILTRGGVAWQSCQDGRRVLQCLGSWMPEVLLVDVAMPGILGFELVEQIRRDEVLADTKIILLSSVYNRRAYKRPPQKLYGADACIEGHQLESDLVSRIFSLTGGPRHDTGKEQSKISTRAVANISSSLPAAAEPDKEGECSEKARHLAEMIAADIALFNQDLVDEGIRSGRIFSLLAGPFEEGKRLFAKRIPGVADGEKYLSQALETLIDRRRRELSAAGL